MTPHVSPVRFAIALVVVVLLLAMATSAFAAAVALTPRQAIERAIVERMGGSVAVLVDVLRTDVTSEPGLRAQVDPAARSGHPVRFALSANGVQRGTAVASVEVTTQYVRAARAIQRDETITAEAIEIVTGELDDVAFQRLPAADAVIGLRARRAIAAGEPLTGAIVMVPPVVQTGDRVTATVNAGAAQVSAEAIASGSGQIGDVIRVTAVGTRRAVRARIVGAGAVEVIP
jgi:flagella basal body P-ring formation protein FlgA